MGKQYHLYSARLLRAYEDGNHFLVGLYRASSVDSRRFVASMPDAREWEEKRELKEKAQWRGRLLTEATSQDADPFEGLDSESERASGQMTYTLRNIPRCCMEADSIRMLRHLAYLLAHTYLLALERNNVQFKIS